MGGAEGGGGGRQTTDRQTGKQAGMYANIQTEAFDKRKNTQARKERSATVYISYSTRVCFKFWLHTHIAMVS